jgi:hypothetical protein
MNMMGIGQLYNLKNDITNLIEEKNKRNNSLISKILINYLRNKKDKHELLDKCTHLCYINGVSTYLSFTLKIPKMNQSPLSVSINPWSICSQLGYIPVNLFNSTEYFYASNLAKTGFDKSVELLGRDICLDIIDLQNYLSSCNNLLESMQIKIKELLHEYPLLEVIDTLNLIRKYRISSLNKLNKDEFRLIIDKLIEAYLRDILAMISKEDVD